MYKSLNMRKKVRLSIIGSEVANGFILDKNTNFFAQELFSMGYEVEESRIIRDDEEAILQTWKDLSANGDLIISCGGLGPTDDDLTVDLLAKYLGVDIVYDSYAEKKLRVFFKSRGQTKTTLERALRQVRIPEGCQALKNSVGLAPGIFTRQIPLIALPGFPDEIKAIWPEAKKLIQEFSFQQQETRIVPVWGIGESTLFNKLKLDDDIEIGVHALPMGSRLFLRSKENSSQSLDNAEDAIRQDFASQMVEDPLARVIDHLIEKEQTIATVESCTGGLIAKLITDQPGVSKVFKGSVVSYANEIKQNIVAVNPQSLAEHGAVSEQVAVQMARGGLENLKTDICIATTGVAGPGGGSKQKPVGTCYLAIALRESQQVYVARLYFPLGRDRFRMAVAHSSFLALYQSQIFFSTVEDWATTEFGKLFKRVNL